MDSAYTNKALHAAIDDSENGPECSRCQKSLHGLSIPEGSFLCDICCKLEPRRTRESNPGVLINQKVNDRLNGGYLDYLPGQRNLLSDDDEDYVNGSGADTPTSLVGNAPKAKRKFNSTSRMVVGVSTGPKIDEYGPYELCMMHRLFEVNDGFAGQITLAQVPDHFQLLMLYDKSSADEGSTQNRVYKNTKRMTTLIELGRRSDGSKVESREDLFDIQAKGKDVIYDFVEPAAKAEVNRSRRNTTPLNTHQKNFASSLNVYCKLAKTYPDVHVLPPLTEQAVKPPPKRQRKQGPTPAPAAALAAAPAAVPAAVPRAASQGVLILPAETARLLTKVLSSPPGDPPVILNAAEARIMLEVTNKMIATLSAASFEDMPALVPASDPSASAEAGEAIEAIKAVEAGEERDGGEAIEAIKAVEAGEERDGGEAAEERDGGEAGEERDDGSDLWLDVPPSPSGPSGFGSDYTSFHYSHIGFGEGASDDDDAYEEP